MKFDLCQKNRGKLLLLSESRYFLLSLFSHSWFYVSIESHFLERKEPRHISVRDTLIKAGGGARREMLWGATAVEVPIVSKANEF